MVKPSGDQMFDGRDLVKTTDHQTSQLRVQPGERPDNTFLQYSKSNRPTSVESYDQPRYVAMTTRMNMILDFPLQVRPQDSLWFLRVAHRGLGVRPQLIPSEFGPDGGGCIKYE